MAHRAESELGFSAVERDPQRELESVGKRLSSRIRQRAPGFQAAPAAAPSVEESAESTTVRLIAE